MGNNLMSLKKDQLVEMIEQSNLTIESLKAKTDQPDSAPSLPNLALRAWLPSSLDEKVQKKDGTYFDAVTQGKNKAGKDWIKFQIQASHYNERFQKRFYSKFYLKVKALGEIRDQIIELIESNQRLVALTASYLPYEYSLRDSEGNDLPPVQVDEFFLTSVTPVPRRDASPTAPEQEELDV